MLLRGHGVSGMKAVTKAPNSFHFLRQGSVGSGIGPSSFTL